jgi:hypothetical protein
LFKSCLAASHQRHQQRRLHAEYAIFTITILITFLSSTHTWIITYAYCICLLGHWAAGRLNQAQPVRLGYIPPKKTNTNYRGWVGLRPNQPNWFWAKNVFSKTYHYALSFYFTHFILIAFLDIIKFQKQYMWILLNLFVGPSCFLLTLLYVWFVGFYCKVQVGYAILVFPFFSL